MRMIIGQRLVLSLLAGLVSPIDAAFIIRSKDSNQWATGMARYIPLRRVMAVSTIFYDGNSTVTGQGTLDTDCELLMADPTGVWVPIDFEGPKLCTGGALVTEANAGEVFFAGIEGNETKLLNVDFVGSDNPVPGTNFPILAGKIPVAMDTGNPFDDFIYVAMHDVSDQGTMTGFGNDRASSLNGIISYWEKATDPAVLAKDSSNHNVPHITKMNPLTGEISWLGIYEAQKGSATIAAMTSLEYSLVICGSTNGIGDVVGYDDDGDWDGYVAFVQPATGNMDSDFEDPDTGLSEQRGHLRIESNEEGKNDYIYDMCLVGGGSLYVVGTTEGTIAGDSQGGAFVVKIDPLRRTISTKIQLSGSNKSGLKIICSDTNVYIGGHVHNDDLVSEDNLQHVFVAAYDVALSEQKWLVEISTSPYFGETRQDQLVELEINPAGDINVLLNSQVLSKGINHVVFLDLQADTGENEIQKGATAEESAGGIPSGGLAGVEPSVNNTESSTESQTSSSNGKNQQAVIAVSVVIPVLAALAVVIYTFRGRNSQADPKAPVKPLEEAPAEDDSAPPIV